MKKRVNFSKHVSAINIPYEDRKGEWMQMGVDRCRFKRRIANYQMSLRRSCWKKLRKHIVEYYDSSMTL